MNDCCGLCALCGPSSLCRHGVMIVGQTGSGKSVTWKMLKKTLTRLHKEKKGSQYQIVRVCLELSGLFGIAILLLGNPLNLVDLLVKY